MIFQLMQTQSFYKIKSFVKRRDISTQLWFLFDEHVAFFKLRIPEKRNILLFKVLFFFIAEWYTGAAVVNCNVFYLKIEFDTCLHILIIMDVQFSKIKNIAKFKTSLPLCAVMCISVLINVSNLPFFHPGTLDRGVKFFIDYHL